MIHEAIAELQAVSWWTCFTLTLKIGSAWLLGMLVACLPLALLRLLGDDD